MPLKLPHSDAMAWCPQLPNTVADLCAGTIRCLARPCPASVVTLPPAHDVKWFF